MRSTKPDGKPKGPRKHHYLPAVYLSRFSDEETFPGRERHVYVHRAKPAKTIRQTVEKVAFINDLYTLTDTAGDTDPYYIERNWWDIESKLASAIEKLENSRRVALDSKIWTRTLIPFVATLLVRGPSFNKSFEARSPVYNPRNGLVTPDNTNIARYIELQMMLAPVMCSRWVVMHATTVEPIITNDLGYTYYNAPDHPESGYVIPLDPKTALGIVPRRSRILAEGQWPANWITPIEHYQMLPHEQQGLNRSLAAAAQEFVAGPTAASVDGVSDAVLDSNELVPLYLGAFTPRILRAHEYDWHRFACALTRSPGDARIADFKMEASLLVSGWAPKAIFIAVGNPSPRVIGLNYNPPYITAHLEDPASFDSDLADAVNATRYAISDTPERIDRLAGSPEPLPGFNPIRRSSQ